jgi:Ca-activated chloride channel family protein
MRSWSKAGVVSLAATLGCAAAADQKPTFSTGVELVYVTVVVEDDKGAPVSGLTQADFSVLEDGKPRPIDLFATADDARMAPDVSLLVDTSGSMSTYTEKLTLAALQILERIPQARRACVLSFDNDIRVWRPDAPPSSLVHDMVQARKENGATALNTALVTALQQVPDPAPRSALILLSDGEDVGSRVTRAQVLDALKHSRVTVYALSHGAETAMSMPHGNGVAQWGGQHRHEGGEFLKRLGELTGGRAYSADDGPFEAVFERILKEIASQYVLGFAPGRPDKAGEHKLKVQAGRPGLKIRYRPAYVLEVPAR